MGSTSTICVPDGAEALVRQAWRLLCTRNRLLKVLLKSYWVWQVPELSKWIVKLASRSMGADSEEYCSCCQNYRDTVDLVRLLIDDRATAEPILTNQPLVRALLTEMDRNTWVRVEMVSYYADRMRDLEQAHALSHLPQACSSQFLKN